MNTHITLYFKEGSSDKVYQAAIKPQGPGFVVNFAYGRRGSTLSTGTKTSAPVNIETAQKIYDKLVREKMAKGYSPGLDGTPYQSTANQERATNILPQLLNPISESEVQRLVNDPAWALQEKLDGRRVLIRKAGPEIHGINRKGLLIGLPETVFQCIRNIQSDFVVDGECIGEVFHAFDVLEVDGHDQRPLPYRRRLVQLYSLLNRPNLRYIKVVRTATDEAGKKRLYHQLGVEKKEGVVLKRLDAPYIPGRPNSGGTQLKHKFYATVSAVVARVNDQRSVEVRLLNGKGWQNCGNVTIPANHSIPEVGQVVEVRYLYAFKESNALYQPVYLGARTDVEQHECGLSQLKYKPEEEC